MIVLMARIFTCIPICFFMLGNIEIDEFLEMIQQADAQLTP